MKEVKIAILRVPGTNRDYDLKRVFDSLSVRAEVVRMNELKKKRLASYDAVILPGGFSYGDWIRSGSIWGKKFIAFFKKEIGGFMKEGKPILGICNGMQVLVEAGILPGFKGISTTPEIAMATNASAHFECRWIYLKHVSRGKCKITKQIPHNAIIATPVCHGEGKVTFQPGKESEMLKRLEDNDQIVFKYCKEHGEPANEEYPYNPNGSYADIAGICDPTGNIMALMPHPENSSFWYLFPNWTRMKEKRTDGLVIFDNLVEYLKNR